MKLYWALFFLICILAIIPRATELIAGNYLFGYDQGQAYLAVKQIVVDHKFTLIGTPVGGQGGFFQGAGWYYLLSIPFFFLHGNPYGGMILMFLIGVGTVILTMLVGREMFGWRTGLLIGFLIATSPTIIPQSRFIWAPFPVSFLSVIFLYLFYQTLQGKKYCLSLLAFTISLMSHFETAIAGTLLISSILFIPILIWKRLITWKTFAFAIILLAIPQIPLLLFDIRHNFIITKGIVHYNQSGLSNNHQVTFLYFTLMVKQHFDVFISVFSSMFTPASDYWLPILISVLIGITFCVKDKSIPFAKKFFIIFLSSTPLTLFAVFLFYAWPIWNWWVLELPIFYCFLFGILLMQFSKFSIGKLVLIISLFYFSFVYVQYTIHAYRYDYPDYGGTAKIKGKSDAIDYIYKDAHGKQFGLLIFTPPVYTYDYDYLLWWYGLKKYHYLPYKKKNGDFYLLMEKDPSKPWSYNGWLETVIKVGKVEKTVTLPSGIIIQKRYL